MAAHEGLPSLAVGLQSLTVNLIGYESNAQFVNPLTLLWNRVVDETWVCEMGAQIGLTKSSFTYTNGVRVDAFEDNVSIRQGGSPLAPDAVLSMDFARRYVDAFGAGNWMAVAVEFLAEISISANPEYVGLETWPGIAEDVALRDIQPRFGTNVFYSFPDRRLRVEISRDPGSVPSGLTCFAWIHRELSPDPHQAQSELHSVLSGWETDWEEVVLAATQLLTGTMETRDS